MPGKRKRGSDASLDAAFSEIQSGKQQRVTFKLTQAVAKTAHAFKLAKGFERQKLGRRQKKAANEQQFQDLERINQEIAAVKTLDNAVCAKQFLYKTLLKIKAVALSPDLPEEVRKPLVQQWDAAHLNVNARLCNSNPVKEVLPAVLEEVQRALGVEVERRDVKGKKRLRKGDFEGKCGGEDTTTAGEGGDAIGEAGRGRLMPETGRARREREQLEQNIGHDEMEDGDSDGSAMFADFDDRLGSSDDGESDDEDDVGALERQLELEGIRQGSKAKSKPTKYDVEADLSMSEAASDSDSDLPEPRKGPPPKKTTFMPSLTMGGYVSGSGSDLDDDFDEAPKKNRRGQRARQQIWEKKFGQKAKHVQKQDCNQGWDAKRGATDSSRGRGSARGGRAGGRGDRGPTGSNGVGMGERRAGKPVKPVVKKDDSGPLHPSWEAAKRAKEKKSAPVAFQGKKMTFD